MGGDDILVFHLFLRFYLNPPRPCGRGQGVVVVPAVPAVLKSAPPVWAGTLLAQTMYSQSFHLNPPRPCGRGQDTFCKAFKLNTLKSAPPVWAGTNSVFVIVFIFKLKSAPPVWAGTHQGHAYHLSSIHLNPPRPCGRGHRPMGRGIRRSRYLNPPRPCGRGRGVPKLFTVM